MAKLEGGKADGDKASVMLPSEIAGRLQGVFMGDGVVYAGV